MNKLLLILAFSFTFLNASDIGVGSALNALNDYKYETPHGRDMRVPRMQKLIVVAFEKSTGDLVNKYLKTKDPYYLLKNDATFIADISKMPTAITKMIAIPQMKKYEHLVYLNYNEEFSKSFPVKKGTLTLLHVDNYKISNISFVTTQKELIAAIEK
ncbi:hypothetical protein N9A28_07755 [Sulfurimonas sp.]|nr:hypothetical protein [Sulfurimonas sp.]